MVLVLGIVLTAAVIFGVAAFAVSGVGAMSDSGPDSSGDGLPVERVRAADIDRARFGLAFRGYRMSEVDAVLERLREDVRGYEDELAALRDPALAALRDPEGAALRDPALAALREPALAALRDPEGDPAPAEATAPAQEF